MKVVGILQNQWFINPDRVIKLLEGREIDFLDRFTKNMLFAGCLTGKRIMNFFGDCAARFIWINSSREISGRPGFKPSVDPQYVRTRLIDLQPDMILVFGKCASAAIDAAFPNGEIRNVLGRNIVVIKGPHPAARRKEAVEELKSMAFDFENIILRNVIGD